MFSVVGLVELVHFDTI